MSIPVNKLALLQHIVKNLHVEPWKKDGPLNQDQLRALQLFTGKIGPKGIVGIRIEAAESVSQLSDAIYTTSAYQRGVTYAAVANKLTDTIILNYAVKSNAAIGGNDMSFVEKEVDDWFKAQIASHEFYIPCFITPWHGPAFSIGPVHFTHVQDFAPAERAETGPMYDLTFGVVFEQMGRAAANWIATVKVEDCTKERAQEIANLAVDIALAGLQLCIPEDDARHMARMTGRTMPVFSQAVSRSAGNLSAGLTNSEPGRAFGPGFLEKRLADTKPVIDSVGGRLATFISGKAGLAELEQAWPDAAYWFHEGLAEPLDTIAVSKLETAIEILLRSESTKGSKARVLKAIEAFYGLKSEDFINPQSQTTVEQFAQGFVRDRSRILHGTWSTLNHSLRASRPSLTTLVRDLLAQYSIVLDRYAVAAAPNDDVEAFLSFIDAERQAATKPSAPATATAPAGG